VIWEGWEPLEIGGTQPLFEAKVYVFFLAERLGSLLFLTLRSVAFFTFTSKFQRLTDPPNPPVPPMFLSIIYIL